jgi:hypothetical protein
MRVKLQGLLDAKKKYVEHPTSFLICFVYHLILQIVENRTKKI